MQPVLNASPEADLRQVAVAVTYEGQTLHAETCLVRTRADMGRVVFRVHAAAMKMRSDIDPEKLRLAVAAVPDV